jgi:ribokinase
VALARAGAKVAHAGQVGLDGAWLVEKLAQEGIDTSRVVVGSAPTGQAIIQVDRHGENSIVLCAGANRRIGPDDVDGMLAHLAADTWLLVQNETSSVEHALRRAAECGLRVAFNPAPFDAGVLEMPWRDVDLLCVNEIEGAALAGRQQPDEIVATLAAEAPNCEILLTLGAAGVWYHGPGGGIRHDACPVRPVDTTAAGDTFLGYYLAWRDQGHAPRESLEIATRAAALCVTRPGAMDSIPRLAEVR